MEAELVKMSPKGQLVVPLDIREDEGFKEGDRFVSFHIKGGVVFKKLNLPNADVEFEKIAKDIQKQFEKQGIKENDVDEAVRWARKK